jgi:hypothetical protein
VNRITRFIPSQACTATKQFGIAPAVADVHSHAYASSKPLEERKAEGQREIEKLEAKLADLRQRH